MGATLRKESFTRVISEAVMGGWVWGLFAATAFHPERKGDRERDKQHGEKDVAGLGREREEDRGWENGVHDAVSMPGTAAGRHGPGEGGRSARSHGPLYFGRPLRKLGPRGKNPRHRRRPPDAAADL